MAKPQQALAKQRINITGSYTEVNPPFFLFFLRATSTKRAITSHQISYTESKEIKCEGNS